MNFKEASKDFLEFIEVTRSNGTYRYQLGKVNLLNDYFGDTDIRTIDKKSIIRFIAHRRNINPSITAVSLNKYIATLKRIIKYNLDKDIPFEKLPEIKKEVPILSNETVNRIFSHYQQNLKRPESLRNYTLFRLLHDTGLRISEAINLKIGDFNFQTKTIHVKITKTRVERYVFYTETTSRLIRRMMADERINDYIFINYINGTQMKIDNIMTIIKRLEKKLQLTEKINPHKWRHTFATNFLKNGGNLETLRLILGHTNLRTTQIYLHVDKTHLRDEYFRLYN